MAELADTVLRSPSLYTAPGRILAAVAPPAGAAIGTGGDIASIFAAVLAALAVAGTISGW